MCKYCEQIAITNEFSGKQFFVNMEDVVKRGCGDICIAINNRGEYVLHYEDEKTPRPDFMDIKINFCPICGRKLMESNIAPKLKELAEKHFDTFDTDECYDTPAIGGYYE